MIIVNSEICSLPKKDEMLKTTKRAELIEELLAIGTALSGSQDLEELLNLMEEKCND